ncbi:RING-H2 finger protein ATL80 [Oryza sativa Japonica Group]|uniref:RING-type E3 ubiquitin transferase n=3 Tax=Oryza TaxID=4527 RepID=A0A0P0VNC7_ORYSJ|nr:RING-H2 finger protein ATL80 [Oryza sativa Japonica Group]XP_052141220.1 RING-H2 finger protein ATL80-like [Oryza glaberrima]USH99940.1 putative RING-H2 finger protein [Oryza sativa Japonica Group]BAD07573.1 putative ring finger protein [Oryza sativa Japonica Group]BAF09682.1 Os02g0686100 [Oryza sativa Japonica Group]BAS80335.1 Os02g0686100 [Oryza sativa Japonica Group]|eukprot:NP_001047768.1 Os02g0686100 [Oryza sativa Japonica Group]
MARMLLEAAASGSVEDSLNSDLVVILAGLLCALICVLGLGLVARCACTRRWARAAGGGTAAGGGGGGAAAANKGVKKEVLRSLPTVTYVSDGGGGEAEECAICLVEFEDGQAVRVLPQCDHRFHAACIDTWLRAHSSCPSCRRVLVAAEMPPGERCGRCGARSGGRGIGALLLNYWKAPACDAEGPELA